MHGTEMIEPTALIRSRCLVGNRVAIFRLAKFGELSCDGAANFKSLADFRVPEYKAILEIMETTAIRCRDFAAHRTAQRPIAPAEDLEFFPDLSGRVESYWMRNQDPRLGLPSAGRAFQFFCPPPDVANSGLLRRRDGGAAAYSVLGSNCSALTRSSIHGIDTGIHWQTRCHPRKRQHRQNEECRHGGSRLQVHGVPHFRSNWLSPSRQGGACRPPSHLRFDGIDPAYNRVALSEPQNSAYLLPSAK